MPSRSTFTVVPVLLTGPRLATSSAAFSALPMVSENDRREKSAGGTPNVGFYKLKNPKYLARVAINLRETN